MSFKEQKIIRLLGRMCGNILTIGVLYGDGRKEVTTYEIRAEKGGGRKPGIPLQRRSLGA